jgi:hypothetical protein
MTKSPLFNFIAGIVGGGILATIIVLHIVTGQVEARNAQLGDQFATSAQSIQHQAAERERILQATVDAYKSRTDACEAKFTIGTVVYQRQPLASIPLLHGIAAFDVNDIGNPKPSLYIPAQVDIYTDRLDVRYEWIDGRTGASKGVQVARSPSAVPQ